MKKIRRQQYKIYFLLGFLMPNFNLSLMDVSISQDINFRRLKSPRQISELRLAYQWGSYGQGEGEFDQPNGIVTSPDGRIVYVLDSLNCRIQKFEAETGKYLTQWGFPHPEEGEERGGELAYPLGLDISPDGQTLYVLNTSDARVELFTKDGEYRGGWAIDKRKGDKHPFPADFALSPDGGRLLISNSDNNRLEFYDPQKGGLSEVAVKLGQPRSPGGLPKGVAFKPDGSEFLVAVPSEHRIMAFDAYSPYKYLYELKSEGNGVLGGLFRPEGIAWHPSGRWIFAADPAFSQIVVFDATSKKDLLHINIPPKIDANSGHARLISSRPSRITFSSDGRNAYVTDRAQNRILVFDIDFK